MAGLSLVATRRLLVIGTLGIAAACTVHRVEVREVARPADSVFVVTPVRAHLLDGRTVIYASGVMVRQDFWLRAAWRRTWATVLETASPAVRERLADL
jgi:hypothetical protein